jgi:hypothetical protein
VHIEMIIVITSEVLSSSILMDNVSLIFALCVQVASIVYSKSMALHIKLAQCQNQVHRNRKFLRP